MRCHCCGGQGGRRRASSKREARKTVRGIRRDNKADAIAEGLSTWEQARADAEKASQEERMWAEHEAAA
jgi:hypothetical protein